MESALAVTGLPGAADYFINWLHDAAPHAEHLGHIAPPEPPFLASYRPRFFSSEDFDALQSICEILIPTDEHPGAKEARCSLYIDFVLDASGEYAPERQKQWRSAMDQLRELGFHKADRADREALVKAMAEPEVDHVAHHPGYAAYRLIKAENAFAFYSSRLGLIDTLNYKGDTFNRTFPACDHPEHHA